VVAIIRAKLADGTIAKGVNAADLAALQSFYAGRSTPPLWITEMGFSAKGQDAISEIEKADDWGLDAKAFDLPASNAIPGSPDSQAEAEIKLDLAVLKYARYARGGLEALRRKPADQGAHRRPHRDRSRGRPRRLSRVAATEARAIPAAAAGAPEGPWQVCG
jgi:hypothetical protein